MAAPAVIRLAAAAYPIEDLPDWAALEAKLGAWVAEAAGAGAEIAVFPEYAAMEAALIGGVVPGQGAPADWCRAAADLAPNYRDLLAGLARSHQITLLSGSGPWAQGGAYLNRAYLCPPEGAPWAVDKLQLTPWERANLPLIPGQALRAWDRPQGRLGALICYDSEFPALAQALAADILLIPACTDSAAGQGRLRVAAQARALEGQCVTLHAPLLGAVPRCPVVDENHGQAGIFGPPDHGLPADGVLALGGWDAPGWVIADAPLADIIARRQTGEVTLRADLTALAARGLPPLL